MSGVLLEYQNIHSMAHLGSANSDTCSGWLPKDGDQDEFVTILNIANSNCLRCPKCTAA